MTIKFKEPMVSISKSQFDATIVEAKAEVAREIFEEIERTCVDTFGNFYIGATHGAFAELKKKYVPQEETKNE